MPVFLLVNTFNGHKNTNGTYDRVLVESVHRTYEAADRADAKLQAGVKRANGQGSYLPTLIVEWHGVRPKAGERVNGVRSALHPEVGDLY